MAMTILVAGCLYHPDQTIFFSSLDMYLPSSETERYGITNGSCPLVFCLQKSRRGFEHSYTFVLGSINDSDTDRKWLLKTFAVRFFGMSAKVERCPFVNTFRARHTDAITLYELLEVFFFGFSHTIFALFLNFLYSGKHFSLFSLSFSAIAIAIVSLMSLLSHGGNFGCFTRLRFKGAYLLTTVR